MGGPVEKFKRQGVEVAIWRGDKGLSASIKKSYKNKATNEYKETKVFFEDDLERLIEVCKEAVAFLRAQKGTSEERVFIMPDPKPSSDHDDIPF